jgi:hypothetical protein
MCRFKNFNRIKLVCFLKFVVYKINSEMVKSGMMVLTGRENIDIADTDVLCVGCCRILLERWWSRGREKVDVM